MKSGRCFVTQEKLDLSRRLRQKSNKSERLAWNILRDRRCAGLKFRRQQVMRGFVVDFFCPQYRLVIEVDGSSHIGRVDYDAWRQSAIEEQRVTFIRITNEDLLERPERLEIRIREFLAEATPNPSPTEGRG